jgi:hypothetical protein
MTPQELLTKVADHFEAHPETWTQGEFRSRGRMCVVGALMQFGLIEDYEIAREQLRAVVGRNPVTWNDAPSRTVAEVVAKLREAAR